ncbi:hypothetical protein DICPUDRAFT_157554 [Dictyostelium purpureum]|uniref:Uncharacterized protein n=1 Tax=Dictyostelium purpureum TaxID=5786 RepID=F0ZZF0_DICPU|nr:uncharacterized protein DICPUDRAFT_157554 [Dictyostelium purpureum]EGC30696.1 hypothetical protein DICPUDRAFT_157554 [Dictyostelium purpureum]|eukprot:XP_003292794.1 hypothetical protein DICPUDRAFT_157554 [Dictyostelium purpureum]
MPKKTSKAPEICQPGGMCYRFPPPCCSICCMIFSIFSFVGLISIYGLISNDYTKVQGEAYWNTEQIEGGKKASLIGSFIYLGVAGLCLFLFFCRKFTAPKKNPEDDE